MTPTSSNDNPLPLSRYRVVDFGTAWAGPMAAQLLADLGAEVIKVESHARMDGLRLGRPIVGDDIAGGDRGLWPELQPVFHGINRNKLSVTLNLKTEKGLGLVRELLGRSDIALNNYSPSVLDRLGLGYREMREICPDIILVSMPALGEVGPLRDVLAYAPIIQALSGLMSLVGYSGDEPLVGELQAPWSNVVAAIHAALAAVAALRHRNLTGQGQFIEVAQLEATTSMLGEAFLDYQMTGVIPGPKGNNDGVHAPHNNYPCSEPDRWVAIAVSSDEQWESFCAALGDAGWTRDERFQDMKGRLEHVTELDALISAWTRHHTAQDIVDVLQAHGVAAMQVMNVEDQFLDPHLQERQAYLEIEHPHVGIEWLYGMPWLLGETPGGIRAPAPLMGQHNRYVFQELLGISPEETARLEEKQTIY